MLRYGKIYFGNLFFHTYSTSEGLYNVHDTDGKPDSDHLRSFLAGQMEVVVHHEIG